MAEQNQKVQNLAGSPDFSDQLNEVLQQNDELSYMITNNIMETIFSKEENSTGDLVYRPVLVEIETERQAIIPNENANAEPGVETIKSKIKIPMITLCPLNFLSVSHAGMDSTGKTEITLAQAPVPAGMNTLVTMLTQSIAPSTL